MDVGEVKDDKKINGEEKIVDQELKTKKEQKVKAEKKKKDKDEINIPPSVNLKTHYQLPNHLKQVSIFDSFTEKLQEQRDYFKELHITQQEQVIRNTRKLESLQEDIDKIFKSQHEEIRTQFGKFASDQNQALAKSEQLMKASVYEEL